MAFELGTEKLKATAEPATAGERERLWKMVKEKNPSFKDYEEKTNRTNPLVILAPSRS